MSNQLILSESSHFTQGQEIILTSHPHQFSSIWYRKNVSVINQFEVEFQIKIPGSFENSRMSSDVNGTHGSGNDFEENPVNGDGGLFSFVISGTPIYSYTSEFLNS
eukprot:TRINITY_DN15261_c0_g1_i2.p1 TRINITY_DN15261_c0_g1~~TRINITY_DN15261_c0_g1_i2.p1  ORF type:complete len:106 (-),score=11.65 TRINITY_DN15261_c0_g1_i2:124-441(-)